jgi:hypothetical protein
LRRDARQAAGDGRDDRRARRLHKGTHRTWLQPDGSGKATLVEAKKSLGKYRGGFIPLWKGEHRCSLKDLPPGTPIYVSEGIEDGLSVALARPSAGDRGRVAVGNIGALELPDHCPVYILGAARREDAGDRGVRGRGRRGCRSAVTPCSWSIRRKGLRTITMRARGAGRSRRQSGGGV